MLQHNATMEFKTSRDEFYLRFQLVSFNRHKTRQIIELSLPGAKDYNKVKIWNGISQKTIIAITM